MLPPPIATALRKPVLTVQLVALPGGETPGEYHWLKDECPLADDAKYVGVLTPTLSIRDFTDNDVAGYAYVVSNVWGMATSLCAQVVFVNAANPTPLPPYTNWATAAATLQDAADVATRGGLILVTNGVYDRGGRSLGAALTNRVILDRAATLFGLNGPAETVIEGRWHPGTTNGNTAVRCAWLANGAVLDGFTLRNGATLAGGDTNTVQSGGGVWCFSTGERITGCVISNNSAAVRGGGVMRGWLTDCLLTANSARADGGGACSKTASWSETSLSAGRAPPAPC